MTKSEQQKIHTMVLALTRSCLQHNTLPDYLDTDFSMMLGDDLDAIRTKSQKLPMTGLEYEKI